ncbi:MAG: N-acetylmuramoyl-L-alanine amidase [Planctomycetes bacterium]|nr:N-acetylmuramoyl-L-alanine amidase [Planctomycetota bacterium]
MNRTTQGPTRHGIGHTAAWTALLLCGVAAAAPRPAAAEPKPSAHWVPAASSNYTTTSGRHITQIVIHDIEGGAAGAISRFRSPSAHVSAHYVIDYDGTLTQMVAEKNIAWHAGNSLINGRSIGIEHAGFAYHGHYTEAEYRKSAALVRWLCDHYRIPKDRHHIIAHAEVPDPDGSGYGGVSHHTDPGPRWDWAHYMALVRGGGSSSGSGGGSASPPPSAGSLHAVKITAGGGFAGVNVRSGPGLGYPIVGAALNTQVYVSMDAASGLRKIWYTGGTGWCLGSYLTGVHATARKVTPADATVRKGASASAASAGTAHHNQVYVTTGAVGEWRTIWFDGAARYLRTAASTAVGL